ncbi:hypothetical protein [Undibacterium luofuense]|uniref:Uncharacterized protein n=1 Tax=Undibacterium luofuense TaxID=2828733 RepID=A0A941DS13_9BURK|nr:hypothetical protein [Undibacterium luofuense]MBR7783816.1 hypothetical protein [Undibacterium luofuense]
MSVRAHLLLKLVLLLPCLSLHNSANAARASLQYNGFYVTSPVLSDGSYYCEYLRFYPDGAAISVSSECGAVARRTINRWFHRDKSGNPPENVSSGQFGISGNHLNFRSRLKDGEVIYWGKIRQRSLRMHSLSRITGYRDFVTYRFYPYAEPENLRE